MMCHKARFGPQDKAPGAPEGKDEKFRMTNLEWGVDFFSMTNLVKTSSVGQI